MLASFFNSNLCQATVPEWVLANTSESVAIRFARYARCSSVRPVPGTSITEPAGSMKSEISEAEEPVSQLLYVTSLGVS